MAAEVLTPKKATAHRAFTVLSSVLGTHPRDDMPQLQPKARGETVTLEELGPAADVDRLLRLRAITPLVLTPDELERQAQLQSHYPDHDDRTLFPARARKPEAPPASLAEAAGARFGPPPAKDSPMQPVV